MTSRDSSWSGPKSQVRRSIYGPGDAGIDRARGRFWRSPLVLSGRHCGGCVAAFRRLSLVLFVVLLAASVAAAQSGEATGSISGRIFDADTGAPIENVNVILEHPDPEDGSEPRQDLKLTGIEGDFEFDSVPAGSYTLSFIKSGYRTSSLTNFEVIAGQDNVANFPMPTAPVVVGGEVMELEAYTVEAAMVGELMEGLELRLESDQMLNLLSAGDLSKYAASDVADALKRVAGVNIVEGQFAIIRGLEDRYSGTLFNGAPVPSPDPDRQSVQLDLFPSEVVNNLVLAKTFAPESPSNAAGGSIDILTTAYPDALTLKLSVGAGFEEEAADRFLEYRSGSTVGKEADTPKDIIETDFGAALGARLPVLGRELRFRGVVNHEVDYRTAKGTQEGREPERRDVARRISGGLGIGEAALSDGRFDTIESTREEQLTAYAALGIDLDEDGDHRIDGTYFFTDKDDETVEQRENGYFSDLDYSPLIDATNDEDLQRIVLNNTYRRVATLSSRLGPGALRAEVTDEPSRGALWFANFGRSTSFKSSRDLSVYQLNGGHDFDLLDGLEITWAANHARTNEDSNSRGMRYFYEPCGFSGQFGCPGDVSRISVPTVFPTRVRDLGPGNFFASGASGGIVLSEIDVEEVQWFGRLDAKQHVELLDFVDLEATSGVWWEKADRDVDALFVETVTVGGQSQWFLDSPTLPQLGSTLFDRFDASRGDRKSTNDSQREITAGHASLKLTLWEDLDLFGGLRFEEIHIESNNTPFTGEAFQFNRPPIFPVAYLFFDRLDNPTAAGGFEVTRPPDPDQTFNDQILGINSPINPDTGFVDFLTFEQIQSIVNGEIDEWKVLPSLGVTYRGPIEGLTIRTSYTETVARPSFRELGYYVTVEPGTDERTVGNPQLGLSDVKSYDARFEYVYGDLGDLFAFSAFYKTIDDPIESIVVRNPLDLNSGSAALFRTFFNNPNTARLWGIEVEARKAFDFLPSIGLDFPGVEHLQYLSIGGNFTYIDAKVDRTEAEISRAQPFFEIEDGVTRRYNSLERSRRLFGQPEWIANADVSFDHPDWGTTVTLAVFAISDVLDAAGTASLDPNGDALSLTLDRYLDDFYQLDLVASQRIWKGLKAKLSVKNLTDTTRRRVYDRDQTRKTYKERSRRFGRDWSFSLAYVIEF
jgi:TonB-dependent receptor